MSAENIPRTVRSFFELEKEESVSLSSNQLEIDNRKTEIKRVVKRISSLIEEHQHACVPLNVHFGADELRIVINALRDHASGGSGVLSLDSYDEIISHCLNRLFEELVEEPSNILFTTKTEKDATRYDAMDSSFWIECLNQFETNIN